MGSKSGSLLQTGSFSDFVIASRGAEIKVHRACLAGVSPFFDGLIGNGFSESINQRAEMQETPAAIFIVIWYIYTGTYPPMKHSKLIWTPKLDRNFEHAAPPGTPEFLSRLFLPHMEVIALSDMVMLPKLREIALDELRRQVKKFPADHGKPARYDDPDHESWASNRDFQTAVSKAYCLEDESLATLKLFFAWACVYNSWRWNSGPKELENLALKYPEFGWALYVERDKFGPRCFYSCYCCNEWLANYLDALVYEDEGGVTKLTCQCRFRGFCMDGCKLADDAALKRPPHYCQKCMSVSRKNPLRYMVRGESGLVVVADGSFCRASPRGVFHRFLNN